MRWCGLISLFLLFNSTGFASAKPMVLNFDGDTVPHYLKLNGDYLVSYPSALGVAISAPLLWRGADWRRAGISGLAIGGAVLLEKRIKSIVLANHSTALTETANIVEPFGNNYFPFLLVGMYATGEVFKQPKITHASLMGVRSLAVSTLIYMSTKGLIRRQRPDETTNNLSFRAPFTYGFTSFPSGHTNTAFSVATALALEFKQTKWVPPLVYGVATLTSASRIYHNRHWASDVVVASLMGHFITKGLYKWEQHRVQKKIPKSAPL